MTTCEGFAIGRLDGCPTDVKQRLANGLGTVLAVLGDRCEEFKFNFQKMTEDAIKPNADPTANLPVLFSSRQYRSHAVPTATQFPKTIPPAGSNAIDEYWFGLAPVGNTMCARSGSSVYYYNNTISNPTWVRWFGSSGIWCFKGVYNSHISSTPDPNNPGFNKVSYVVQFDEETGSIVPLTLFPNLTNVQMSGNGLALFARGSGGWARWNDAWQPVGNNNGDLWLSPSFDGSSFVQFKTGSSTFFYNLGSTLVQKEITTNSNDNIYAAVVGKTVFLARGKNVYTVGSLNDLQELGDLGNRVATGVWADDQTVWVSTDKGTHISSDLGWTWTVMDNYFAVGPNLFTSPGSDMISQGPILTFAQGVAYPLRLSNSGLLYNETGTWANNYQELPTSTTFTTIANNTVAMALSPNGRYLVTQKNGVVTLYLNVWNSDRFAAWCKGTADGCKNSYKIYCNQFKSIDEDCKTDTPGTPVDPGPPGDPGGGPGTDPDPPDEGFPTWAIALISVVGLGILVGVLYAVFKKPKTRSLSSANTPVSTSVSTPLATPLSSATTSSLSSS
jgi:hypothetical protein